MRITTELMTGWMTEAERSDKLKDQKRLQTVIQMAENMGKKLLPPDFPEQLVEEVGKRLGEKANNVTFFTGEYQADSMIWQWKRQPN